MFPTSRQHSMYYVHKVILSVYVSVLKIDEEVAKLLELKAQLGGDDGKHQFVLKTAKVKLIYSHTNFTHRAPKIFKKIINFYLSLNLSI